MALKLGPRGRRLWREMNGAKLTASRRALLEEACRLADRLDRLDAILRGDEDAWLRLQESEAAVVIVVDKLLAETRQQQVAFKQLVAELRQGAAGAGASRAERQAAAAGVTTGGGGAANGVTDLTARIASRRSPPAG